MSFGMSAGGCCMSESIITTASPAARADAETNSNTDTAEPKTAIALGTDDDIPDFNSSKRNAKEAT